MAIQAEKRGTQPKPSEIPVKVGRISGFSLGRMVLYIIPFYQSHQEPGTTGELIDFCQTDQVMLELLALSQSGDKHL